MLSTREEAATKAEAFALGANDYLVKLPDRIDLGRELRTYVQTNKYIHLKSDAAAPESLKKILRDRADENRERKARLIKILEEMIIEGDYYASGQSLEQKSPVPKIALYNSVSYLIKNIYTKLGYLDALQDDPLKEILVSQMTMKKARMALVYC